MADLSLFKEVPRSPARPPASRPQLAEQARRSKINKASGRASRAGLTPYRSPLERSDHVLEGQGSSEGPGLVVEKPARPLIPPEP